MKRFAIILLVIGALAGAGVASAQRSGGGGMHGGGGGMSGGMQGGGGWGGGSHGSWSGSGGGWHGGGSWNGGWHGSGWHGSGWHGGTNVVVGFGGPWWGWWPGYYPYYGYPVSYPYGYPSYGYGDYYPAPTYDTGAYVQRPDTGYQGGQQYQFQGAQVTSDGYSYYCPNPAGYYPQVPTCAAGWLRVVPQGAPGQGAPPQR